MNSSEKVCASDFIRITCNGFRLRAAVKMWASVLHLLGAPSPAVEHFLIIMLH
jgi:hypothetical protein